MPNWSLTEARCKHLSSKLHIPHLSTLHLSAPKRASCLQKCGANRISERFDPASPQNLSHVYWAIMLMDAGNSAHTNRHLHGWVVLGLFEFGQSRGHKLRDCCKYTCARHTNIVHSNKCDHTNCQTGTQTHICSQNPTNKKQERHWTCVFIVLRLMKLSSLREHSILPASSKCNTITCDLCFFLTDIKQQIDCKSQEKV